MGLQRHLKQVIISHCPLVSDFIVLLHLASGISGMLFVANLDGGLANTVFISSSISQEHGRERGESES